MCVFQTSQICILLFHLFLNTVVVPVVCSLQWTVYPLFAIFRAIVSLEVFIETKILSKVYKYYTVRENFIFPPARGPTSHMILASKRNV